MFVFPLIYLFSFFSAIINIIRSNKEGILYFFIFGLPIYITSLTVTYKYGFASAIPLLQACKEIIVLITLGILIYGLNKKIRFHIVDKLVLAYFLYVLLYVFLPLGPYTFFQKLIAFKSLAFFPFVYFTGRLCDFRKINLSKCFHYICLVAIAAAIVLLYEVFRDQHLQTQTGYADFYYYIFNQEPAGNYGLSWTFETPNGLKRFASFLSCPLELATNTLGTLSILAALATRDNNQIRFNKFILITFICTLLSITFALSRASYLSYFIIIYTYAVVTRKKLWLKIFNYTIITALFLGLLFGLLWIKGDVYDLIIDTINLRDTSSLSHVLDWLAGLQSIIQHPLGLGLGASGKISGALGQNIGGENQFIILGVQAGIIALIIYVLLYIYLISTAVFIFRSSQGKTRKLALLVLLLKVGLIIPLLTAEVETYIYIMYITWFFSGLLISKASAYSLIPELHSIKQFQ